VAGVELLNVLRPTVAVAWPGAFLALALAEHLQWRRVLREDATGERAIAFGHEVRRTCPFVPALAGRITRETELDGVSLHEGDRLVLDVPGTNQDPGWWDDAHRFRPERFADVMPDPFAFVPQGGGDTRTGHRCPGEPLTVRMLAQTARVLAGLDFEVLGDTSYDPTRIPTLPGRGLTIRSDL
jgi:fatty-acid peroxygenase